jgi:hypothetical protein
MDIRSHVVITIVLIPAALLASACSEVAATVATPTLAITNTVAVKDAPQSIREIPIPEGVADVNWREVGDGSGEVYFDAPVSIFKDRYELFQFYRRELPLLGWELCDRGSCNFPTETDTDTETYYFGSQSSGPWVEIGVSTMIEEGSAVTIRFWKK